MNMLAIRVLARKGFIAASRNPYSFAKNYLPPNLSILSKVKTQKSTSLVPQHLLLSSYSTFSSQKQPKNKEQPSDSEIVQRQGRQSNHLEISQQNEESYEIVEKKYEETNVPGADSTRKYSGLSQMQKEIISSNQFNLSDPSIIPKTGSSSSFAGLSESITQISLGKAKIRQQNQVFLSQIDPLNIPADLDIRFDSEKQIRIIGTIVKKEETNQLDEKLMTDKNKDQVKMKVIADTVEHKQMSQFMEKQFNGLKAKVHYGKKRYRRLDLLLALLIILVLEPTVTTLNDYYWCLDSIKQVQKERMKEIVNMKQQSFIKVLFNNRDFNKQI